MSDTTLRRIKSIEPRPGHKLLVTWDDVPPMLVSFADHVRRGRIFSFLQDEAEFAKARIGDRRRTVEWLDPNDQGAGPLIDVDAETLLLMANQQRSEGLFRRLLHLVWNPPHSPDAPPRSQPSPHPRAT
jgi:hypothetical protein